MRHTHTHTRARACHPLLAHLHTTTTAVGIFGTKAGMMSYFMEDGLCVPATVIALEEGNQVTMVKTDETDGYNAVQVRCVALRCAGESGGWGSAAHACTAGSPSTNRIGTPSRNGNGRQQDATQPDATQQVGYKVVPERKVKKPELGHLKKAGCPPMRHLREFKVCGGAARTSLGLVCADG